MMDMVSRKTPAGWRDASVQVALILAANLVVGGAITMAIGALTGANPFHPGGSSAGWAALVGWLQVSFGATALARRASARFVNDAEEADDLRRDGRALLLGGGALIAAGASLIVLSLAGTGHPVPPGAGRVAGLSLFALAAILAALRLRGLDELNRAIAREGNHLAFLWLFWVGGVWAILAHLGFAAAPAALDWLTMLSGFGFVAGLTAAGRRGAFENPA
jgi:hypothetical protein